VSSITLTVKVLPEAYEPELGETESVAADAVDTKPSTPNIKPIILYLFIILII
jgi:hypothetical protein